MLSTLTTLYPFNQFYRLLFLFFNIQSPILNDQLTKAGAIWVCKEYCLKYLLSWSIIVNKRDLFHTSQIYGEIGFPKFMARDGIIFLHFDTNFPNIIVMVDIFWQLLYLFIFILFVISPISCTHRYTFPLFQIKAYFIFVITFVTLTSRSAAKLTYLPFITL